MRNNQFKLYGPGPRASEATGILRFQERERVSAKFDLSSVRPEAEPDNGLVQPNAAGQRPSFVAMVVRSLINGFWKISNDAPENFMTSNHRKLAGPFLAEIKDRVTIGVAINYL